MRGRGCLVQGKSGESGGKGTWGGTRGQSPEDLIGHCRTLWTWFQSNGKVCEQVSCKIWKGTGLRVSSLPFFCSDRK